MLKPALLASLALSFSSSVLAIAPGSHYAHHVARQQAPLCPTTGGSRKIGIVVDSSGSNADTDPNRLRVAAAKQLNGALVPGSDQITAIDFDSTASVIYPLGDPSGAGPTFDTINASGGTFIAGGLKAATDEITKPAAGTTAGRSGIVVFTDGEDSSLSTLIKEVDRAGSLGIRVAFGFLSPNPPAGAQTLLTAILNTGGIYSTITTPEAQQSFVNLVLAHGLTASDNGSGASVLFPGLTTASNVSASSARTFTYTAAAGEKLVFTVTALSGQAIDATLRDVKASSDISSAKSDAKGVASIKYDATAPIDLGLVISTTNASVGLITVGLNSSLGAGNYSNPCILPPTNTTGPKNNISTTYNLPPYTSTVLKPSTTTVYACPTCPPTVMTYPCPVCPPTYQTKACPTCPVVTATGTAGVVAPPPPAVTTTVAPYTSNGVVVTPSGTGAVGASATTTGGTPLYTGAAAGKSISGAWVLAAAGAVAAAVAA